MQHDSTFAMLQLPIDESTEVQHLVVPRGIPRSARLGWRPQAVCVHHGTEPENGHSASDSRVTCQAPEPTASLEWKRSVVEQTFEPGASVARVARDNGINANQVWAWRKLYAQGLLIEDAHMGTMLPVVADAQSDPAAALAPETTNAPAPREAAKGSIQLPHGNTSVRIEYVPDTRILRLVLERILR